MDSWSTQPQDPPACCESPPLLSRKSSSLPSLLGGALSQGRPHRYHDCPVRAQPGAGSRTCISCFNLKQQWEVTDLSPRSKPRLRRVGSFDQSHTVLRWQSQDWSNPAQPRTVSPRDHCTQEEALGAPEPCHLPWLSARAARTNQVAISPSSGSQKSKIQGSAGLVSSQASLLGLRWLTSVCPSFCVWLCPNLIL